MADMTGTTVATWNPAVWSRIPTVTYRPNRVLVPLLDHTWEPELGVGRGNLVNIPGFTQNTGASNRGAGTGTFGTGAATTFTANTEAQTQLQVNRLYYLAWRVPVEIKAQVMPNYLTLILEGAGQADAIQEDADVAGDNTNGIDAFSTTVGTDNVDVTEDDIFTVETNLNNNNAPTADRYLVVSPATRASLLKIESLRNQLYGAAIGNLDGNVGPSYMGGGGNNYMGRVLTFNVHMSNNLEAGTAGKKNGVFHRQAIAYAGQVNLQTVEHMNIQDGAFHQFMTFMTCGFKIVKGGFGNELDGK